MSALHQTLEDHVARGTAPGLVAALGYADGWSGGLGTDFFVDPSGNFGVVMAQVEMDAEIFGLFGDVVALLD